MAQAIQFTTHSAERFQQRFGVRVRTGVDVDISQTFRAVGKAYLHNKTGHTIQTFIPRDQSIRMVMEVDQTNGSVITVMASGPIVDAVYRQNTH